MRVHVYLHTHTHTHIKKERIAFLTKDAKTIEFSQDEFEYLSYSTHKDKLTMGHRLKLKS